MPLMTNFSLLHRPGPHQCSNNVPHLCKRRGRHQRSPIMSKPSPLDSPLENLRTFSRNQLSLATMVEEAARRLEETMETQDHQAAFNLDHLLSSQVPDKIHGMAEMSGLNPRPLSSLDRPPWCQARDRSPHKP